MERNAARRLAGIGRWVFMLTLVQAFHLSEAAQAACSHLVAPRSDSLDTLAWLSEVVVTGSWVSNSLTSQLPANKPLRDSRTPCSGLSCSKPIPLSPASVAFAEPVGANQCVSLESPARLLVAAVGGTVVDDAVTASQRRAH